jgi:hypothetical protein
MGIGVTAAAFVDATLWEEHRLPVNVFPLVAFGADDAGMSAVQHEAGAIMVERSGRRERLHRMTLRAFSAEILLMIVDMALLAGRFEAEKAQFFRV